MVLENVAMKSRWAKLGPTSGARTVLAAFAALWFAASLLAQNAQPPDRNNSFASPYGQSTDDYNQRLSDLSRKLSGQVEETPSPSGAADYRIGPDDQLDITVLEAAELDRSPRVSAGGEISLPLLGTIRAAGLTARELEIVIQELLRRTYIKEPHVSVQVREMQSHPVAVFGAVKKPGVFQIRGPKTVVEMLSLAEGLDADAGDTVIVEHRRETAQPADAPDANGGASPPDAGSAASAPVASAGGVPTNPQPAGSAAPGSNGSSDTVAIDLKKLLSTGDPKLNVLVYPGDVVKVPNADLVYVVGEVGKPGGFQLKSNENVSVLQAIALAEGLKHTSASSRSRIIRTDPVTGKRQEIPIDINKITAGKIADPMLEPRDIVFVPNSAGRAAFYRGVEAAISVGSGVAVYRP